MGEAEPAAGTQIGGYRIAREGGRGAVGIVFEAEDPQGRTVALKGLVPPPLLPEEERESVRARFFREARALAAVDHPTVVTVYGAGEADGLLYLAMEFLSGPNLRRLLAQTGPLPPEQVVAIGLQLCAALD